MFTRHDLPNRLSSIIPHIHKKSLYIINSLLSSSPLRWHLETQTIFIQLIKILPLYNYFERNSQTMWDTLRICILIRIDDVRSLFYVFRRGRMQKKTGKFAVLKNVCICTIYIAWDYLNTSRNLCVFTCVNISDLFISGRYDTSWISKRVHHPHENIPRSTTMRYFYEGPAARCAQLRESRLNYLFAL